MRAQSGFEDESKRVYCRISCSRIPFIAWRNCSYGTGGVARHSSWRTVKRLKKVWMECDIMGRQRRDGGNDDDDEESKRNDLRLSLSDNHTLPASAPNSGRQSNNNSTDANNSNSNTLSNPQSAALHCQPLKAVLYKNTKCIADLSVAQDSHILNLSQDARIEQVWATGFAQLCQSTCHLYRF